MFDNEYNGRKTGETIRQLRKQANLTQEQLGEILGVKKSAVAKYENGRVENLKRITIEKLSELFEVPPSTILGLNAENSDTLTPIDIIYDDYFPLYYYKNLSAGSFDEIIAPDEAEAVVYVPIKFQRRKKRLVAFQINGTSMNNVIPDHSIVVFEKAEHYKTNDIVVAQRRNGEFTIKRFIKNESSIVLVPDSKDKTHLPIAITADDELKLYGKVIWYCPPAEIFE